MTHEDRGHYAKKHSPDRKVKPDVIDALKKESSDGKISCATAHRIAGELNQSPSEVGFTMDILEFRIVKCQMGIFGYTPEKKVVQPEAYVPQSLEHAIRNQLKNDRLPCHAAWELAKQFNIKKMAVASACEALKIKISPCQLGAF